jgi:hypothetical protein
MKRIALIAIAIAVVCAAFAIEPCDGHSCPKPRLEFKP